MGRTLAIASATYTQFGTIEVRLVDQPEDSFLAVPDDMDNRHRQELAAWEAAGNTIEPFEPPPPPPPPEPTATERLILDQLASISARLDDTATRIDTLERERAPPAEEPRT